MTWNEKAAKEYYDSAENLRKQIAKLKDDLKSEDSLSIQDRLRSKIRLLTDIRTEKLQEAFVLSHYYDKDTTNSLLDCKPSIGYGSPIDVKCFKGMR